MRRGESLLFELKRIDDKLRGIAMKPFIKKETYFVFTHKSINSQPSLKLFWLLVYKYAFLSESHILSFRLIHLPEPSTQQTDCWASSVFAFFIEVTIEINSHFRSWPSRFIWFDYGVFHNAIITRIFWQFFEASTWRSQAKVVILKKLTIDLIFFERLKITSQQFTT